MNSIAAAVTTLQKLQEDSAFLDQLYSLPKAKQDLVRSLVEALHSTQAAPVPYDDKRWAGPFPKREKRPIPVAGEVTLNLIKSDPFFTQWKGKTLADGFKNWYRCNINSETKDGCPRPFHVSRLPELKQYLQQNVMIDAARPAVAVATKEDEQEVSVG